MKDVNKDNKRQPSQLVEMFGKSFFFGYLNTVNVANYILLSFDIWKYQVAGGHIYTAKFMTTTCKCGSYSSKLLFCVCNIEVMMVDIMLTRAHFAI